MSALVQYHVLTGGRASGSDRAFDRDEAQDIRRHLEALGISILRQDGQGPAVDSEAVVASRAIEETVPDIQAARRRGIPVLLRAELLARFVHDRRTIAVAGTSGKSTVTAMIFHILRSAGRDPSLITGGNLIALQEAGRLGNAWVGGSDLLVIEADESDGSLVRYEPWMGVLLNLRRDHDEPEAMARVFETFRRRVGGPFLVGEDANLKAFSEGAVVFGFGPECDVRAGKVEVGREASGFTISGVRFRLPVPGLHNVENAVAAAAACQAAGVSLEAEAAALAGFRGVARRFQVVGKAAGAEVVDDFAHNPDKIRATLATARGRGKRVLAIFQPHGYGPTRFLRDDLIEALASGLRPSDRLWMPEIYYAGGTVTRDISSRDIVEALAARGIRAFFGERRQDLVDPVVGEARPGDVIVVMGARDPTLPDFCRRIAERLAGGEGGGGVGA